MLISIIPFSAYNLAILFAPGKRPVAILICIPNVACGVYHRRCAYWLRRLAGVLLGPVSRWSS